MEPVIRTVGLTKHFGSVVALEDLDLEVRRGEIFGFLGPNGAGKSTTLRLLLGLIRPTRGRAWIGGVPVSDVRRAHRLVSYVPGDVALWPQLTGREILELLGNLAGHTDARLRDELIERFQVDPDKRARAYSKGNRQKIALVAAFMTRPEVLLLDEPTAGLDPLMEAEFQDVVRDAAAQGQTVFLSSHLLDEVEDVCSRVAILREGRLVDIRALEELHELSTSIFEATLARPAPDLAGVPGVVSVETTATGLRATVSGAPDAFLAALLPARVVRLHSHTPTLEQIFLTYYQASAGQRRAVEAAHGAVTGRESVPAGDRHDH